jgi:hypothetical protein
LSGAQSFVQSGPKVDNGGEGAVAIVHRRVQLLVGHLDRSGLFGGGSTVAWGGSGDLVRLHLVVCGLEVGRHIVGVGAGVSQGAGKRRRERKHRESAAGHEAGGTWAGPKHAGEHHTWQRRGWAGGPDSRHEARAHRCEYVRRDEVARGVRQAGTGVASRRQARGARDSQAIENASKTMACNVNSVLQVTGKGAQNKARLPFDS